MNNSSQIPWEMRKDYEGCNHAYAYTNHSMYAQDYTPEFMVISVCIWGFVGNGIVIWLLVFCIKGNSFTTYILNLAGADFGVLIAACGVALLNLAFRNDHEHFSLFLNELFNVGFTTGQFLLTVIGIDRCMLVFFPIWHRCHRPLRLPTIICAVIWVISLLVCEVPSILNMNEYLESEYLELCFFVNAVLCLPLLSISTLALFIKVYFKSQQHRRGKLLVAITLALLFFLIFAFPFNVLYILNFLYCSAYHDLYIWGFLLTSINSSMNPVIYYLIGRKKRSLTRGSLKVILERVFREKDMLTSHGGDVCTDVSMTEM